jgi:hypothetical protein
MDLLDAKVGRFGLMRIGRTLFHLTHEQRVLETARSGVDIVYGLDDMYHHANRGERIGGWRVLRCDGDGAELEKTTPHHCAMEEGILAQALSSVGALAVVSQSECFREGAAACRFVIQSGGRRWRS